MNPSIIAFVIFALMLAISDVLAVKSKAILDSMLTFSVLLCVAFWCGMPYDYVTDSGFLAIAYVCLALLLTNMGSCISFNQFVQEWKTVVIGFVMVAIICVSVYFGGSIFIDKLYAYAGAPVVAGSFVSYLTMAEPLKEAGLNPGFPNNHTSIQESRNNYCYFWRASNGLTPRSRYSCSCFIRTSPCAGAFPGSR